MQKILLDNYVKGVFLGLGKDMAGHKFYAYKINEEMHIVYENRTVMREKIQNISKNPDEYMWTPFAHYNV